MTALAGKHAATLLRTQSASKIPALQMVQKQALLSFLPA